MERQSEIHDPADSVRTGALQRTTAVGRRKAPVSGFVLPVGLWEPPSRLNGKFEPL